MKHNNSKTGNESGKIFGLIFLAIIWIWLAYYTFAYGGVTLKNILVIVISGIIIFVPLWKRYIHPIIERLKEQ